jgi:hypothetical protein
VNRSHLSVSDIAEQTGLPPRTLTVAEAAAYLGTYPLAIRRMIDRGELQTVGQESFPCRGGWRWRLDVASVEARKLALAKPS